MVLRRPFQGVHTTFTSGVDELLPSHETKQAGADARLWISFLKVSE